MSSNQVNRSDEKKRIDRLADQACAKKGVILLLQGRDGMTCWMELQMYMLQHNTITVIPLSAVGQLLPTIENLRGHCDSGTKYCHESDEQQIRGRIVGNCVRGRPLANHQIAKVMSLIKGRLSQLAAQVKTDEGKEAICNVLGKEDGLRMIAYFVDGPKPL
ncbi:hypothetical protein E4U42_004872 [Claviceps africana]|uniref:Uncharacterized protein n=1 Tax=Claviceps africana TaxID=83212 RepID=A0A8K0JCC9_9HYPO|nr:hypothetical protein E4U42_004872 [Claviceps africana]